jgi:hypothetical protein
VENSVAPRADREVQTFAAALANLPPVRKLGDSQLADQVRDFRALAVAFLSVDAPELSIDRFRTMPTDAVIAEIEEMQNALYELLPRLLPNLVLPVPMEVPIGAEAQSPLGLKARLTVGERRRMTPELVGMRTDSLALAMLDDLFRRPRRCPLWTCEICGAVIPQPARGRLARFCSGRCKSRGIPSASRRALYVANHRRRRREEDLARARQATKGLAKDQQYRALQGTFPGRPRKALLHLLRTVRENEKTRAARSASSSSAIATPPDRPGPGSRSPR